MALIHEHFLILVVDTVVCIEFLHDILYSASNLQGPLFQFFTNAFVFFCRMGTVGDVKLKVCIHVDKSFLIVCV